MPVITTSCFNVNIDRNCRNYRKYRKLSNLSPLLLSLKCCCKDGCKVSCLLVSRKLQIANWKLELTQSYVSQVPYDIKNAPLFLDKLQHTVYLLSKTLWNQQLRLDQSAVFMTQSHYLNILTLLLTGIILHNVIGDTISETTYVKIFYFLLPDWGIFSSGDKSCSDKNLKCNWEHSGDFEQLTASFNRFAHGPRDSPENNLTVGMYNIHSLWRTQKKHYPPTCSMKTDLNLATSEESVKHRSHSELFPKSFPNFDGYSTTSPSSSVQRIYVEAYLNESVVNFHTQNSMRTFNQLIKAGTYIASACHNSFGVESNRDKIVKSLRSSGFRIDGLGETTDNSE
jgi:hypothetical protein